MKTATNIYIFNLALADALATSTLPFQSAKYLMNTWPFGELLCKLIIAIDYYNMFTSIFTLTMMSVDRYIAVCHPVRALAFRTPVKAKMINVLIWVASSAIGVPIIIMAVTKVVDNGRPSSFFCTSFSNICNSCSGIVAILNFSYAKWMRRKCRTFFANCTVSISIPAWESGSATKPVVSLACQLIKLCCVRAKHR